MSDEIKPQTNPEAIVVKPDDNDKSLKPYGEIVFYSHSQILYYWPVWLISYVFALITYIGGQTVTIGTTTSKIHPTPGLGLAYLIILISVILFTSVNIRGVWAAFSAAVLVIVGLLFNLLQLWPPILKYLGSLTFHLNFHFYLTMGLVLSALWFLVVFLFDRRHYIVIRPAHLTVVEEIGDAEMNVNMVGVSFEKQRDNFFQHWLLGFGSGDLRIRTKDGKIEFPNVWRISTQIENIHKLIEQRGR